MRRAAIRGVLPAILALAPSLLPVSRPSVAPESSPPTIVLIETDDQRTDSLDPLVGAIGQMPNVRDELVAKGMEFSNAFVTESLCCPGRASILTGQHSHTTGVWQNSGVYGGFGAFRDDPTIATELQGAGYQTALVGKYLNGYNSLYIPPGWDHWAVFKGARDGGAYYDYDLNVDGVVEHHGSGPGDYSTEVLGADAADFIRSATPGQPLFLLVTPYAPHSPSTPAPQYENAFSDLADFRPPNYNEADVSDKPEWVQEIPPMSEQSEEARDEGRKNVYRTLLSVDDAVGEILQALTDTGRLSTTMIALTSDNGVSHGEHRWVDKKAIYEESIRVPLIIRYDPLGSTARTDRHLVLTIDLAPTFLELAGVVNSRLHPDGVSLMPLLQPHSRASPWRTDFLIAYLENPPYWDQVPSFCGVRTERYVYDTLRTGEEELYDLAVDPYQLANVASDPGYASVLERLRPRVLQLCKPAPPGFVWWAVAPPVTVRDFEFRPSVQLQGPGSIVTWKFQGPSSHTVTDQTGLGLFDSGPEAPGSRFQVSLVGAGVYSYQCTIHPAMQGTVDVPLAVIPPKGRPTTTFTVTWAAGSPPTGDVFDVQIKRPTGGWTDWYRATTITSALFVPDQGPGTYSFRSRVRDPATGAASGYSLVVPALVLS